jgi:hypothetical protein
MNGYCALYILCNLQKSLTKKGGTNACENYCSL